MNGSSEKPAFPESGRLLGLDFGTKRLGIAVSNPEQTISSPLENYSRINPDRDAKHLQQVANEYGVAGLVVGLPVHMSGDEGEQAKKAREFGNWTARTTGLPILFQDERYTSAMADVYLESAELSKKKRKARRDKLAAQIMLQAFLDTEDRLQPPGQL